MSVRRPWKAPNVLDGNRSRRLEIEANADAFFFVFWCDKTRGPLDGGLPPSAVFTPASIQPIGQLTTAIFIGNPGRSAGFSCRETARVGWLERPLLVISIQKNIPDLQPSNFTATRTAMLHRGFVARGRGKYCSKMLAVNSMTTSPPTRSSNSNETRAKSDRFLHQQVDLARAGNALRNNAQGPRSIGPTGVINDEPGRIRGDHRMLVDALHEADKRRDQCRIAAQTADHLDETHQRRRVEEMQAADPFRPLATRRRLGGGQRGCIGRERTRSGDMRFFNSRNSSR